MTEGSEIDEAAVESLARDAERLADRPAVAPVLLVGAAAALLLKNMPPREAIAVLEVLLNGAKDGFREAMN